MHKLYCAKKEEQCNANINQVYCKYNSSKKKADWYINYTYKGSCNNGRGGVIGSWENDFKNEEHVRFFNGPWAQPKGNAYSVNSDGSITTTKLLTLPDNFYGPATWYFKLDMGQINQQTFSVYTPDIYNTNKCGRNSSSDTDAKQKVDRNGKPFEWEQYMLYEVGGDGNIQKVGLLHGIISCPSVLTNNPYLDRNTSIAVGNCIQTFFHNNTTLYRKLYMPYNTDQWVAFKIEPGASGKITEVFLYQGNLRK